MTINKDAFCMILSPMSGRFEPVRETISEILLDLGIRPIRIDERGMSLITENILSEITKADLIIADITDGNPNVMYELGFAHALKKPVLHIVEKGAGSIPFDLAGSLYYAYDSPKKPSDAKKFKEKFGGMIASWVRRNLSYA